MQVRRVAGRLVGAIIVVVLAGCSSQTGGSPAAGAAPTLTAAEWAEQFCVAVVAAKPPADSTLGVVNPADPQAVTAALTKQIDALESSIAKLGQVGASPVKAGDEGLQRTKDAFTKARASFTAARDKIAGLAQGDAAGVAAALQTAQQEVKASTKDLGAGLDDSALKAAAATAPTCKANGLS